MLDEIKREIPQLSETALKLKGHLDIDAKRERLAVLQLSTNEPDFWGNTENARTVLQEVKGIENTIKKFEHATGNLEDLKTLIEIVSSDEEEKGLKTEFLNIKKELKELELEALLAGEYDQNNAILSITAGAGGTDSQDWAEILLRMYTRWAESKGYKTEVADISYGDEAGIKGATIIVSGLYAYGYLKGESGVHRLVRISPFSSEGKRHTSFASVELTPEVAEDIKVEINPADLRVDTFRASGPGGQNVNKVSSAVRITHLPTGFVTQSQQQRSQHQNREYAMRVLKAKLYEMMQKEHKTKIDDLKGEKRMIEWGHQIRSYVFQPYTMVKDHRTGVEVGSVEAVIDGALDPFIEAELGMGAK